MSINIYGLVQGVGFRPYLHRKAKKYNLCGTARNTFFGLTALLEGEEADLFAFLNSVKSEPPVLSKIKDIKYTFSEKLSGFVDFKICESEKNHLYGYTFAGADTAPCDACLKEMFDSKDRRYKYPFINCTDCGPRYSIIRSLPYDRSRTVMDAFPMCEKCSGEYEDIDNRRYHAQPNCCDECGPKAFYLNNRGCMISGDPFYNAKKLLSKGGILAVKGTGGIHLACDAFNSAAVEKLRLRKNRPARPLALMARDIDAVKSICQVSSYEERLLSSPARPIVLISKNIDIPAALSFSKRLGVMLPYTPLHYLLFDFDNNFDNNKQSELKEKSASYSNSAPNILVMTSANSKGCPVITENEAALNELSGIADGFLLHDRPVENRIDDSVAAALDSKYTYSCENHARNEKIYFFRRSRGYAPLPLDVCKNVSNIIAFGAEQKGSFTMGKDNCAFPAPHIGDLKNAETFDHYTKTMQKYKELFHINPEYLVCDLHPDYFSSLSAHKMSVELGIPLLSVQHHWAHMTSCMADNDLDEPVFGIIWDGTGLGTDNSIWGCEFLKGDYLSFERSGSIRPLRLPGGDAAVKNINRIALSLLYDSGLIDTFKNTDTLFATPDEKQLLLSMLSNNINTPKASSAGRLFDGVFSLLSLTKTVSFDGEAPQRLEALSDNELPQNSRLISEPPYPLCFYEENGVHTYDIRPLINAVVQDINRGLSSSKISEDFMLTLCHMALEQTKKLNPEKIPAVLSGGVFLNLYLLSGVKRLLESEGYRVYIHNRVSCCDEGLSLGQLMTAASKAALK